MAEHAEILTEIVKMSNDILKIYPTFLGDYVFTKFNVQMAAHVDASKDIVYDWLLTQEELPIGTDLKLSDDFLGTQSDISQSLLSADNWLKKARFCLDLAWKDMMEYQSDSEFNPKIRDLCKEMEKLQNKVVEAMKIDSLRVERDPPFTLECIPEELRSVADEEERNLRDWIFIRDSRKMLAGISQIFGNYVS